MFAVCVIIYLVMFSIVISYNIYTIYRDMNKKYELMNDSIKLLADEIIRINEIDIDLNIAFDRLGSHFELIKTNRKIIDSDIDKINKHIQKLDSKIGIIKSTFDKSESIENQLKYNITNNVMTKIGKRDKVIESRIFELNEKLSNWINSYNKFYRTYNNTMNTIIRNSRKK